LRVRSQVRQRRKTSFALPGRAAVVFHPIVDECLLINRMVYCYATKFRGLQNIITLVKLN
jgi:hypothetical protein